MAGCSEESLLHWILSLLPLHLNLFCPHLNKIHHISLCYTHLHLSCTTLQSYSAPLPTVPSQFPPFMFLMLHKNKNCNAGNCRLLLIKSSSQSAFEFASKPLTGIPYHRYDMVRFFTYSRTVKDSSGTKVELTGSFLSRSGFSFRCSTCEQIYDIVF